MQFWFRSGVSDSAFLPLGETQAGIPCNGPLLLFGSGAADLLLAFSLQGFHLPLFLFKGASHVEGEKKHGRVEKALESDKVG